MQLFNTDESRIKKQELIILGMKFELNIHGVREETADSGDVLTAAVHKTLCLHQAIGRNVTVT